VIEPIAHAGHWLINLLYVAPLLDKHGVQRVGFAAGVLTPNGLAHDIAKLEREGRRDPA
jgi:hypothetical protein